MVLPFALRSDIRSLRPSSVVTRSSRASLANLVAMAVMIYALVVYQMRARSIRLRTGAPYDDRLGPVSAQATRASLTLRMSCC